MKRIGLLALALFSICALADEGNIQTTNARNNECWGKLGAQRLVNEEALGQALASAESLAGQYNTFYQQQEKVYYMYGKKGYSYYREDTLISLNAKLSAEKGKIQTL